MTCPGFDDSTIVRKDFGQYGLALSDTGGIILGSDGLFLPEEAVMAEGIPDAYAGTGQHSEAIVEARCVARSKKEGSLVTFEIDWTGFFTVIGGSIIFHGAVSFSLPYAARTTYKGHSTAAILNISTTLYRRNVYLSSTLRTQIVDGTFTTVLDNSPFTFDTNDRILIYGQYFAAAGATYLWS